MYRLALLFAAASFVSALGLATASDAQTGAASKPAGHKVPMHPSTLTLKSGGHGKPHGRHHGYSGHTFQPPTPIHGTMAGPRI